MFVVVIVIIVAVVSAMIWPAIMAAADVTVEFLHLADQHFDSAFQLQESAFDRFAYLVVRARPYSELNDSGGSPSWPFAITAWRRRRASFRAWSVWIAEAGTLPVRSSSAF